MNHEPFLPPLPAEFVSRLKQIVRPSRLDGVLASFRTSKPTTFRVNTLDAEVQQTQAELEAQGFILHPLSWYPGAFQVAPTQRRALTESSAFREGRIYIQDPSSLLAPLVLAPRPQETVLDLAAAPGGKTLQMAAMMDNRGRISAVEPVKARFYKLRSNLERHRAAIVRTYRIDGRAVGSKTPDRFDRVLLDAPCSSEARFTRLDPGSWKYWSERKIGQMAHKQRRLLESGYRALRPGGVLVYCTCAFAPEENEMVVNSLLQKYPSELTLEAIALPINNVQPGMREWQRRALRQDLSHCVRVIPTAEMNGFFICRLCKAKRNARKLPRERI